MVAGWVFDRLKHDGYAGVFRILQYAYDALVAMRVVAIIRLVAFVTANPARYVQYEIKAAFIDCLLVRVGV